MLSPMNAPPAICPTCGWEGPAPGIHAVESTGITFGGGTVDCPACGGRAEIVSGTYDFVGGVVRLARDANLTLADIARLRKAAKDARRAGQTPDDFAAENPQLAPIVNLIIQQAPGREWLAIVLTVLACIVGYLQSAEYHAEDEQHAAHPPVSTLVLSDGQIKAIGEAVTVQLAPKSRTPAQRSKQPKRTKRPGKTYGKNKRHR
jgi:hypothetical protein